MRALVACLVCFVCLACWPPATACAAAPTPADSAKPVAAPAPSVPNDAPDAASRHVKRTTCRKEARTRKVVGAERTAFIKACVAAP